VSKKVNQADDILFFIFMCYNQANESINQADDFYFLFLCVVIKRMIIKIVNNNVSM